jgi:hypothetical protein
MAESGVVLDGGPVVSAVSQLPASRGPPAGGPVAVTLSDHGPRAVLHAGPPACRRNFWVWLVVPWTTA